MTVPTVPTLFDYFIGFDNALRQMHNTLESKANSYPPFDMYEENDKTILEFALAGYSKENIQVTVENSTLKISANKQKPKSDKYIHQGIALRSFHKQFALSENTVVESAEHKDGVLRVTVAVVVPDEKKPRQIPIL
jgi:molecular chaperone IbpA